MSFDSIKLTCLLWFGALMAALAWPFYLVYIAMRGRGNSVEHTDQIMIPAEAAEIFNLLDLGSPNNRYRLRGFEVVQLSPREKRFRVVDPQMTDSPFSFSIEEYSPGAMISIRGGAENGEPLMAVQDSTSCYRISPASPQACRVEVVETIQFKDDLSLPAMAFHEMLMRISMRIDLIRLKIEAGSTIGAQYASVS